MERKNPEIRRILLLTITALFVLLWVYTAGSKLSAIKTFERQLDNQVFGKSYTPWLIWIIPSFEIGSALFLLFPHTRKMGIVTSTLLMVLFTGYVGLVLLGFFDRRPCSCGGVLSSMSWAIHFWFNCAFLGLGLIGCWLYKAENIE